MQEESSTQPQSDTAVVDNSAPSTETVPSDAVAQGPVASPVAATPEFPDDLVLDEMVAPTSEAVQPTPEVAAAIAEEPAPAVQATPPVETASTESTPANETPPTATPEVSSEPIAPQDAPVDPVLPDETVPSEQVPQPINEPTLAADAAANPAHAPIVTVIVAVIVFVGLSAAALYLYFKK